jgi:3-oxoacyl-[acyl-carrier protein] reductase
MQGRPLGGVGVAGVGDVPYNRDGGMNGVVNQIDLSGKTAIITGAGQGLGRAIAVGLHSAGANVVINYYQDDLNSHEDIPLDEATPNRTRAEEVVAALGDRSFAFPADVRDQEAITQMFDQTLQRWGSVDIVVNNAGITRDRTVKKMTSAEWQQVIDTNLTGVFNVCQQAASRLSDGGRIVSLSSLSAVVGSYGQANYAAAKAGVISLTKVLSRELAGRQITVNAVAPGLILTEMGMAVSDDIRQQMLQQIPLGRFGDPGDVAGAVAFLCSDMASYITGQTLHVNGGWWS